MGAVSQRTKERWPGGSAPGGGLKALQMWSKHHGGQVESALSQQSRSAYRSRAESHLLPAQLHQSFVVGLEAGVGFQEQKDSSINFIGRQTCLNIWQISEDKKTGKTKRGIPGKSCRLVRHAYEWEGREGGRGEGSREYSDRAWDLWLAYIMPKALTSLPQPS